MIPYHFCRRTRWTYCYSADLSFSVECTKDEFSCVVHESRLKFVKRPNQLKCSRRNFRLQSLPLAFHQPARLSKILACLSLQESRHSPLLLATCRDSRSKFLSAKDALPIDVSRFSSFQFPSQHLTVLANQASMITSKLRALFFCSSTVPEAVLVYFSHRSSDLSNPFPCHNPPSLHPLRSCQSLFSKNSSRCLKCLRWLWNFLISCTRRWWRKFDNIFPPTSWEHSFVCRRKIHDWHRRRGETPQPSSVRSCRVWFRSLAGCTCNKFPHPTGGYLTYLCFWVLRCSCRNPRDCRRSMILRRL